MRILMISDVYFPRINGVSTSIQTFRTELEKQGHEVFLIVPSYEESYEDDDRTLRINSRKVVLDPEDRMMKYMEVLALRDYLRAMKIDLVHVHTPFVAHYAGVKIARSLNIPCIITYHTLFEEYLYHYVPWLPKQFLRILARRFSVSQCNQVSGVIAPSSVIVNLLQRYGVKNNIVTIPTGINARKFENGDGVRFRQKLGIPDHKKLLLNVSRVAFEKNIGLLIEVMQKLKELSTETHLVIAGEGPAKENYIAQLQSMGLSENISFVGYLDRNSELVDCYHAADLFVFASKTETQGLVLLEAMAAGTPVVSIAEMGTRDVLQNNIGVKITDGTVQDFSGKILELCNDQQKHEKYSATARQYAREWDSSRLATRLSEFYGSTENNWKTNREIPVDQGSVEAESS